MIDTSRVEAVRGSLLDVVRALGFDPKKQGRQWMICCPFHEDKTPSLSLNSEKGLWKCFGCEAKGDTISFVRQHKRLEFVAALEETERLAGITSKTNGKHRSNGKTSGNGHKGGNGSAIALVVEARLAKVAGAEAPATPAASTASPSQDPGDLQALAEVCAYYQAALWEQCGGALEYLRSRGLGDVEMLRHFGVGYCGGTLREKIGSTVEERLKKLGVLNSHGFEHFQGCVVFPIQGEDGVTKSLYGRRVELAGSAAPEHKNLPQHLYLPGPHRGLWNLRGCQDQDQVVLTEAIIDAMSLWQLGERSVTALYGTQGFTGEHEALLRSSAVKRVVLALDSDRAGEASAKALAAKLEGFGKEALRIRWPEGMKDANDFLRSGAGKERLASLLASAERLVQPQAAPAGDPCEGWHVERRDAHTALLRGNGCEYEVRGISRVSVDSMRVVLSARSAQGVLCTDRVDLYGARSRRGFALLCAGKGGAQAARVEQDLEALRSLIERMRMEDDEHRKAAHQPKPHAMTEAEREEALRLLRDSRLMERVAEALTLRGYVGEDTNKKLCWLIASSRKLESPLSCIMRSQSGAGKSHLFEKVVELMPQEDVEYYSRLTPQALYYMDPKQLVHKLLIIDERAGSAEADYPLRSLQTQKRLSLGVPVKNPATGSTRTMRLVIYGPIAYMEGTTQDNINPENANRCFIIFMDESEAQTRRIHEAQLRARGLDGWDAQMRGDRLAEAHRNAQRLLKPVKVINPFQGLIRFPSHWIRTRRDYDRFLSLIEVVTFVHQYQRTEKVDDQGREYIESTAEDYRMAYELASEALGDGLEDLARPVKEFLVRMESGVKKAAAAAKVAPAEYWLGLTEALQWSGQPYHTTRRYLQQLEEHEFVEMRSGGRGGRSRYRLTGRTAVQGMLAGLTTPEELAARLAGEGKV